MMLLGTSLVSFHISYISSELRYIRNEIRINFSFQSNKEGMTVVSMIHL
jgi:hypothetical protein